MDDPFGLSRFVQAHEQVMPAVESELRAGRKRSHWMWFVFPQLRALGRSEMAQRFGIASLAEARAYLEHRVLGPRLVACADLVTAIRGRTAREIFGETDAMKLRSSMTLFEAASPGTGEFEEVLDHLYEGTRDRATLRLLAGD